MRMTIRPTSRRPTPCPCRRRARAPSSASRTYRARSTRSSKAAPWARQARQRQLEAVPPTRRTWPASARRFRRRGAPLSTGKTPNSSHGHSSAGAGWRGAPCCGVLASVMPARCSRRSAGARYRAAIRATRTSQRAKRAHTSRPESGGRSRRGDEAPAERPRGFCFCSPRCEPRDARADEMATARPELTPPRPSRRRRLPEAMRMHVPALQTDVAVGRGRR
jgi:hypothetical protein